MKLLLDHNLSPKLVTRLADRYPDSQHVFLLDMGEADDLEIWDYARQHNYVVVTRDSDYNDLSLLRGFPPKVIWIRRGNCSTAEIERLLRSAGGAIEDFAKSSASGVLTLL
jgi:predicted nuclease of predicted toxin-antitoxin system